MQTKLVYVLTCVPEATYIQQALMSVWSVRYYNPDATIILLTDNKTDVLLREDTNSSEILRYITEKKVITFEDSVTMHYRSRWLKSQVRELVDGDFLFIDCDTICNNSLIDIDNCDALVAMVPDEHMCVSKYPQSLMQPLIKDTKKIGYDITKETLYFNSGVMYAKDLPIVYDFWKCWHECWLEGERKGIKQDQPSLGKANLLYGHIIQRLPDIWNTLIYMNPIFAKEGKILHFWNFRNKSFLFAKPFLDYLKKNGLTEYAKHCILNPLQSVLPFDNILTRSNIFQYFQYAKQIREQRSLYAKHVDPTLKDFPWSEDFNLLRKYIKIKILRKKNICDVFFT